MFYIRYVVCYFSYNNLRERVLADLAMHLSFKLFIPDCFYVFVSRDGYSFKN